ncbi:MULTISPECIES: hypothetical protein [unclassified Luteimonas]|uniref:hypothetical protein n=1 Tax=unclassified Luteimonas TaxID=2629088 RepID=UPI001600A87A|nr:MULTISPECIES: hypothetical protein [unclassified Luteimonas]MBB1471890.1 hypothetical protein [Luteimonas sp. MC1782]MBB6599381.1 hypothetical protein [Luteimonas sp. MC1825]QOC87092.1 hypothetical protein IDM46_07230 [Luteimonas sp. MC1825]
MNRKLRDTLIALSTSGLLLVVGLLAGNPQTIDSAGPAPATLASAADRGEGAEAGAGQALPRVLRHEAPGRRTSGHRKFALPYFSFARDTRRGRS